MAELHNKRNYSEHEIEIIKTHFPKGGYKEVQKFLPHRSRKAISEKARTLKVPSNKRRESFSDDEIKIIKKYYPIGGAKMVLEYLPNRSNEDSIRHIASKLKISGTTDYFQEFEDEIIREHYPKNGYEKVLEYLPNRDKSSIQQRAMKLGVSYMTYNDDFFEKIDTPLKAYWLGFMYTDGWVTTNNRWGLSLSSKDIDHMQRFLDDMEANCKIKVRKRKGKLKKYPDKEYEECSFMINNSKMHNDLVRCGVVRNKTQVLTFPSLDILPKHLRSHFIRGLYDGDGSYSISTSEQNHKDKIYKYNVFEISFVCFSEVFINELANVLSSEDIKVRVEKTRELNVLRISNKKDALSFLNYVAPIDKNYTILERKYKKILKIREHCLS